MTILNQTTKKITTGYTWGIGYQSIFYIITGALCFTVAYWAGKDIQLDTTGKCIMISLILIGIVAFVSAIHTKFTYREVNEYEATINPTTPFYMVYNHYDVIGQRGDVFILRDKD